VVERAANPTQLPDSGRYGSSTCSRVASSSGASRPALSTTSIAGLFSVRNTSAGDASPSWTIWLASSESLASRNSSSMPVSSVKSSSIVRTRLSCCAL
jgi:hypothetical protein